MSEQLITGATGSDNVPEIKFSVYVANEDLTRGHAVIMNANGYSVDISDNTRPIHGVVMDDAVEGANVKVQTGGFCSYIETNGSVTAGMYLVPHTTTDGVLIGVASASVDAEDVAKAIGIALADDVSTALTAAMLY